MENEQDELKIGQVRFLDKSEPLLHSGKYKIEATQNLRIQSSGSTIFPLNENQQIFVRAPRYSIPSGMVHSVHPAPGSKGDFRMILPFITFDSKQLPWLRTLTEGTKANCQWLALMLFKPEELEADDSNRSPTKVTLTTMKPSEFEEEGISAYTIEVSQSNFNVLVPTPDEREYLSHLRQINAGPHAKDGLEGEGFFSVVISNRLPELDQKYILHLVSLEEIQKNVIGPPNVKSKSRRLVSLYSWGFECTAGEANFEGIARGLDQGLLKPDVPQAATRTDGLSAAQLAAQQNVLQRYEKGYVALNSTTQLGEPTFAWYRGPFVPIIPENITNMSSQPFISSDEAMIYDPDTGIFDQSYATAWQTGRMVTLANNEAAQAIFKWKQHGIALINLINIILTERPDDKPLSAVWLAAQLDSPSSGINKFIQYMTDSFGHLITGDENGHRLLPVQDPSGLRELLDKIPGLVSPEALSSAVAMGEDPNSSLARLVQENESTH